MIKLFQPYIPSNIIPALKETLSSGCLTQGRKVEQFEEEFKKLFKVNYAISLNSGTSALELAYDLVNLRKGDTVISTPFTCTATNIPLLARGINIIWADIDENTLNINKQDVLDKVAMYETGYSIKIKAMIQVHLGGIISNLENLYYEGKKIPIISDACQALGIFTGDMTACSFQAIKTITTGDGGMLIVNNEEDYKKAKLMRWFGINRERVIPDDWTAYKQRMMSFDIEMIGYKRHMNDIAATFGLCGLKDYHKVLEHRRKIFDIYKEGFKDLSGIKFIDGEANVYWLATVLVEKRRDDFAKKLWEAGVETNLVQIRNDIYKIFGGKRADLPVLNSIEDKYISIPIGPHVSEEEAQYIVKIIQNGW
jgi:dTDP-4-amino-4,6-dideoxygalactose transaminase